MKDWRARERCAKPIHEGIAHLGAWMAIACERGPMILEVTERAFMALLKEQGNDLMAKWIDVPTAAGVGRVTWREGT